MSTSAVVHPFSVAAAEVSSIESAALFDLDGAEATLCCLLGPLGAGWRS